MIVSRTSSALLSASLAAALGSAATAQTIGPDCISSGHSDVARNGNNAAGTIIGYSVGSVTCNHGDMPMAASPNNSIRPLMGEEMYRLKTYTAAGGASYQRMEMIGQGWVKWIAVPVNGNSSTCGTCAGSAGTGYMNVNCSDIYGSGFNGPQGMARRSIINATTGYLSGTRGGGTDETAINTRIQVKASDLAGQPAGTKFFIESVHLLPHDASYVRPGQTVAINAMNNAASQEITVNGGVGNAVLVGGGNQQIPVIQRWKDLDPSVSLVTADHDDTPNPDPNFPNTFIRSRYYVASKATDLGGGQWRYEIAVYNLNSDRSAGSLSIPLPATASFTDAANNFAPSHSGEAISNAPWTTTRSGNFVTFATQKFADNAAANAIRWGQMHNFGFTSNVAPSSGAGVIKLFKPGAVQLILANGLALPTVCTADIVPDQALTADDVVAFLAAFFNNALDTADVASIGGIKAPDGQLTADDIVLFLSSFFAGCP